MLEVKRREQPWDEWSRRALRATRSAWYGVTFVGQWCFVAFIVGFYYVRILSTNFSAWNDKPLITGYVEGDGLGNAAFAVHALLAAVMTACGTLQLLPGLRARWPRFHRVSGRVFVSTAVALALGGIGQVWLRGTYLSLVPAVAITVDGILIVIFAVYAVATARRGAFDAHRRWALRTFMAANGVWTLRVGYMFVALAFGGAGMTRRMDGDFDRFWVFGCYLVPLVLLELYLWVERRGGPAARFAVAAALGCATLSACIGLGGAVAFMWLPYL